MTKQGRTDELKEFIEAAEEAVIALEQLPEGAVFAPLIDRAEELLAQLHERTAAAVFPDTVDPAGADVMADYTFHADMMRRDTFGAEMAALHGASVATHPDLARLLRGPAVRARIAAAADARTGATGRPEHELIAEAVSAYQQAVAAQLLARGEQLPWAQIFGEILPGLWTRFKTSKERHEQVAAAALERLRAEQAEEVRLFAEMQVEQERKASDAQVTSEVASQRAETHARQIRAQHLAERLRRTGLQEIRLAGRRLYSVADFVTMLDANALTHAWMDQLEAALEALAKGVRV